MKLEHVRVQLDLAYDSDHDLHPAQWNWRQMLQIPEIPGVRTCRLIKVETLHFTRKEEVILEPEKKVA